MGRQFAAVLGMLAFGATMARGVMHDAAWGSTLGQAIVCLLMFASLGAVAGWMAEKTVDEAIRNQLLVEIESEQNAKRNVATPKRRSKGSDKRSLIEN